ncbi:ABC transporter permease [Halomicroarcula sp. GCM10025817]|uniref:ABC transporter permease n=1 Tax=Haloarcula TaxID=2237 RepID=UPI0023E88FCC|nr:ABC transporter permease [Halomicroarcula sp. SYNS111]
MSHENGYRLKACHGDADECVDGRSRSTGGEAGDRDMATGRYVATRLLWTVLAFYLVLSALFLLAAWAPDPNARRVQVTENPEADQLESYREARGYDDPLADRWLEWVVGYTTGDLGTSVTSDIGPGDSFGRPILALLRSRGGVTAAYVVPAVVVATALGTLLGLYTAVREATALDRLLTGFGFVPVGVPEFVLAEAVVLVAIDWLSLAPYYRPGRALLAPSNLVALTLPMAVVTLTLFAVQFRYTRSESRERTGAAFVRQLEARGAPPREIARQIFRTVAPTLLSLFLVETLGVLFVTAFVVELVFKVPGLGQLGWFAIQSRDVQTLTAVTMVPIALGLVGNLVQDVGHALLDPRVE